MRVNKTRTIRLGLLALLASAVVVPASAQPAQKPNILVIMGDDIGYWNISAYNRGMMGYGLYIIIGNVWEWTTGWYRPGHLRDDAVNPVGPNLVQLRISAGQSPSRVIKGGSYLCAHNS
jgi:Sulfatase-modifying factor enzyme 1